MEMGCKPSVAGIGVSLEPGRECEYPRGGFPIVRQVVGRPAECFSPVPSAADHRMALTSRAPAASRRELCQRVHGLRPAHAWIPFHSGVADAIEFYNAWSEVSSAVM